MGGQSWEGLLVDSHFIPNVETIMKKKNVSDIAGCIEKAIKDDAVNITRSAVGGGLGDDHNIFQLYVSLQTGERFYISVTKVD